MANYFVIGNKFKPYSFEELIQPYQLYKEEYEKQEAAYNELGAKAAIWERLQNTQDENEYKAYQNYMNDLQALSNTLATQGLSRNTRVGVSNMVKRYQSEISPIETAYNKREELDKEWRQTYGKDNSWIGNRPANLTLDEVRRNDYSNLYGVSGEDVANQAEAAAKTASTRRISNLTPVIDQYNQYIKEGIRQGYTVDEVSRILDNSGEFPEIQDIKDSIRQSMGYNSLQSNEEKNKFDSYINNGLLRGLTGKEDASYKAVDESRLPGGSPNKKGEGADSYSSQYRGTEFLSTGSNYAGIQNIDQKFADFKSPIIVTSSRGTEAISNPIQAREALDFLVERKEDVAQSLSNLGISTKDLDKLIANRAKGLIGSTITTSLGNKKYEIELLDNGEFNVREKAIKEGSELLLERKPWEDYSYKDNNDLTTLLNSQIPELVDINLTESNYKQAGVDKVAITDSDIDKIYKKTGISRDIPIGSEAFKNEIGKIPDSGVEKRAFVHLTVPGDDGKATREAITSEFANNLKLSGKNPAKESAGTTLVRKFNKKTGKFEKSSINNWGDIFEFDEEGNITNVSNYELYPESVANGNIVVVTNKGAFEVPMSNFGSTFTQLLNMSTINPQTGQVVSSPRSIVSGYLATPGGYGAAESFMYDLGTLMRNSINYNFAKRQSGTKS